MEFSRQEYWDGKPFAPPEYLPGPGIELRAPALSRFFTIWATRKPIAFMLKTVSRHLFPFHTQHHFCASLQRKIFEMIVMTHCFPFLTSQYLLRPVQSYLLSPPLHWNGFDQGSQCQSQRPLLPPMRAIGSICYEWLPPPPGSTLFPEPPGCHISLAVPLLT